MINLQIDFKHNPHVTISLDEAKELYLELSKIFYDNNQMNVHKIDLDENFYKLINFKKVEVT